jgi:hypothetical protein
MEWYTIELFMNCVLQIDKDNFSSSKYENIVLQIDKAGSDYDLFIFSSLIFNRLSGDEKPILMVLNFKF